MEAGSNSHMISDKKIQEIVCQLNRRLLDEHLVAWTSGNVSQRLSDGSGFYIKPSGVSYSELQPEMIVKCDFDGNSMQGTMRPSSDAASHAYIYRNMPEVGGITHTHSNYASAWAAAGRSIPCVLTAMADEFGGEIPLGPFALIGGDEIGRGVVSTLSMSRSKAVLMKNHGVFAVGKDARASVKTAVMCEDVAKTVWIASLIGNLDPLGQADIDALYRRYQEDYGQ